MPLNTKTMRSNPPILWTTACVKTFLPIREGTLIWLRKRHSATQAVFWTKFVWFRIFWRPVCQKRRRLVHTQAGLRRIRELLYNFLQFWTWIKNNKAEIKIVFKNTAVADLTKAYPVSNGTILRRDNLAGRLLLKHNFVLSFLIHITPISPLVRLSRSFTVL